MIVQESCPSGSFRMQPGPTNASTLLAAFVAPMAGSIASSRESHWERHSDQHEAVLEPTVCLWNAHALCGAEGACC